ncbi:MAG: hypothetical protein MUO26_02370 [Methanotrichaceae archaeon]|nr:hypothetical protein [Methanotrichaceae archaeon]
MRELVLFPAFLIILLLIGIASASYYFEIINVSEVKMVHDSDANFTVAVKGLGSEGAYVGLVFRNLSKNITIIKDSKLRYIYPKGTNTFERTMNVADVKPGNYSFEVGVTAKSPPNWRKAYVIVEPEVPKISEGPGKVTVNETKLPASNETPKKASNAAPGPGIFASLAALLVIFWRYKG